MTATLNVRGDSVNISRIINERFYLMKYGTTYPVRFKYWPVSL